MDDDFRDIENAGAAIDALALKLGGNRVRLGRIWRQVVGPDVEAHTMPTSLHEGVLRIACDSGVWATELRGLSSIILERWNSVTTGKQADSIKVWVDASRVKDPRDALLDTPEIGVKDPQAPDLPPLSPRQLEQIQDMTEPVADPQLRAAITKAIVLTEMARGSNPSEK